MDDRYRGIIGERQVLFIFQEGDRVDITTVLDKPLNSSENGQDIKRQVTNFKIVAYQIPSGCVAAYYPETNPLVPLESVADGCGTPTYKSIPIKLSASTSG